MKNELFVPYRQSLDLRELGFDKPCFGIFYGEDLSTDFDPDHHDINLKSPLYSQAFKFFREKYNLFSEINTYSTTEGYNHSYRILHQRYEPFIYSNNSWLDYEEAELECLKKLIEIVKDKNERE